MAQPKSNGDIYDLIDTRVERMRKELKSDIKEVASDVTALRADVNRLTIAQAISRTQLGALIASISVVVSAVVTVAISKIAGTKA